MPPPTFNQGGARHSFKMDEKIIGRGVVVDLQRSRGRGQKFSFMPSHFYSPGHAPVRAKTGKE